MSTLHTTTDLSLAAVSNVPRVAETSAGRLVPTLVKIVVIVMVVNPSPVGGAEIEDESAVFGRAPKNGAQAELDLPTGDSDEDQQGLAPRVYRALADRSVRSLRVGYPLALQRVQESSSCRELFEALATSGAEKISTSIYTAPTAREARRFCGGGVVAFTQVHSPVTRVCAEFGSVDRRTAAMIIIHEALHYAGMPESPSTPGALSSGEINTLVKQACGL